MATITEDYVSFEVSKLLKEKGMDVSCFNHYTQKNNNDGTSEIVTVCTQQMAMKWLRKVHNIGIFPSTYTITNSKGNKEEHVYGSAIVNLITFDLMCDDIMPRNSYEEAAEAAIKYSLENLI